jgi:hypothetical protein
MADIKPEDLMPLVAAIGFGIQQFNYFLTGRKVCANGQPR